MDALPINADGLFDSGPQPVSTAATWQEVARLQVRGRDALVSVVVGPQQIGGLKVSQSALPDDPAPVDVAVNAGLNQVAMSDVAYVVPTVSFPLAAGTVFQVSLRGEASEVTFWAQSAGAAGGTVQVRGSATPRGGR